VSELPLPRADGGDRFPEWDVTAQSPHWDEVTSRVVLDRLGPPAPLSFFTLLESQTAGALFDQLLDQHEEPRVPVLELIDQRLAKDQTDGWRYSTMPKETDAWRRSLAALDADAVATHGRPFPAVGTEEQRAIIQGVQDLGDRPWHAMPATQVWSLWTRYACTAFYSHPWAWNEIGFSGPAYPRGYKNLGVDRLEPYESRDQQSERDSGTERR
jgi:hypothetical protein